MTPGKVAETILRELRVKLAQQIMQAEDDAVRDRIRWWHARVDGALDRWWPKVKS